MALPTILTTSSTISVLGGFLTTLFAIIYGPAIANRYGFRSKTKQIKKSITRRDRIIQYLDQKIVRLQTKNDRLQKVNEELRLINEKEKRQLERIQQK